MAKDDKPLTPEQERKKRKFLRRRGKFHMWLYHYTSGKLGAKVGAAPVCLLTTNGRKSRLARTVPLFYLKDGDRVVFIASQRGMSTNPDWYLNIVADPKVTVEIDGDAIAMLAHTAEPEERARLWPLAVAMFPDYEKYQALTEREIPIVVCAYGS